MQLTPGQQEIFDDELPRLRDRLDRRKAFMGLPSKGERQADIDRLRIAVEQVRLAGKAFIDGPAGYLSAETFNWLVEAGAVAEELSKRAKSSGVPILKHGMTRPNQYREWLIGVEIPALCEKVFDEQFATTVGGWAMDFARDVLKALGERGAADGTIKRTITTARGRASKTPG